ncbi:RNA methyltransferase [Gemella sp. zg-570]|nr:RNA methyltransferase [Gemella sp. zg-1178]QWQ39527.1 RNA methyltransferase [Gemella sp. zg-570]
MTSLNNKKIKEILKLKNIKQIKKSKKYLVEGLHLVEEAIKSNSIEEVFISENFSKNIDFNNNIKVTIIEDDIRKQLGETVNNQGIFAVCKIEEKELDIKKYKNIVILDKIQDPGNLGTIIRTADAFSFDCVILGKETTSLYSQKVIRSMQGSHFHIDCFENVDILSFLSEMKDFDIFATSLDDSSKFLEGISKINDKYAIILGNEANGVSSEILSKVTNKIKIKMDGQAESLNVGVSSAIIMHYIKNIIK